MQSIYLVIGAPGSGKSWVCEQLKDIYEYYAHDEYKDTYLATILEQGNTATKPILIETPFSVSQLLDPLTNAGFKVTPIFILETPELTAKRYEEREGKPIHKAHLTRIQTYAKRANELKAFSGTSTEVLTHLKTLSKT